MCHVGPQELPEDSQILGSRFQFILLHMSQSDALQEVGGFRKTSMMEWRQWRCKGQNWFMSLSLVFLVNFNKWEMQAFSFVSHIVFLRFYTGIMLVGPDKKWDNFTWKHDINSKVQHNIQNRYIHLLSQSYKGMKFLFRQVWAKKHETGRICPPPFALF